jgi:hypothetical protein
MNQEATYNKQKVVYCCTELLVWRGSSRSELHPIGVIQMASSAAGIMRMGRQTAPTLMGWAQRRAMATATLHTERLPDLDYDYGELEPAISGEIMKIHHQKHHQTYVTNFNKALEQLQSANDPQAIVALQSAINFNGGGMYQAVY